MTMIPQLVALHLNLSHFERKYLHNNGVNEMVRLGTNASVMAHMVRK